MSRRPSGPLRRGWTTGTCATAASTAACEALLGGAFPDPVSVRLPGGQTPAFALARESMEPAAALAAVVKDAGDDPDVTHGAVVEARVSRAAPGRGIVFRAGRGVGTVTLPGLPLPVGEPAINPVPRRMICEHLEAVAARHGVPADFEVEVAIEGGEALALKTWNPRLGIVGGLSILGTTGVVVPFSCAAWIHSIHRGIDVARAAGLTHVAGCTGSTSERLVQAHHALPDIAMLDMGDFAGGLLKYLRRHPVPRLTLGGGFAKLAKLGRGQLDLHSGRSQVDFAWLADRARRAGLDRQALAAVGGAHTALDALQRLGTAAPRLAASVAAAARDVALETLARGSNQSPGIAVEVLVVSRDGALLASSSDDAPASSCPRPAP